MLQTKRHYCIPFGLEIHHYEFPLGISVPKKLEHVRNSDLSTTPSERHIPEEQDCWIIVFKY